MMLTQDQIDRLPVQERQQILELRKTMMTMNYRR